MRHELVCHLGGECGLKAPTDVNAGKLCAFMIHVRSELGSFSRDVCSLGIGLRAHGNVLAGSHGHGASDQTRHSSNENILSQSLRRGNPKNQTSSGYDSIICAEHRRSQPSDPFHAVAFKMPSGHLRHSCTCGLLCY
jgi:hypothetical protein